jgi:hypothetical protein
VWVIGDTARDRAAGVRCLIVGTGRDGFDAVRDLEADAVLANRQFLPALPRGYTDRYTQRYTEGPNMPRRGSPCLPTATSLSTPWWGLPPTDRDVVTIT